MTFLSFKVFSFVIIFVIFSKNIQVLSEFNKKGHDKLVVCYIGTWAAYRPERGSFKIENIDPELCTHYVYSFAGLNASGDAIRSLDAWQDLPDNYGLDGYGRLVQLRQKHPKIKITLAIGGWNEGSKNYSDLAADPNRRARFAVNAIQFIRKYKFDGLDLDWEFPAKRGGDPKDKENFVLLVKELYVLFKKNNLLLTAAFGAGYDTIDVAYDIPQLSKYLDYIHLMCYDYHGQWDQRTGPNAPLYSSDKLSVEYSVQYMLKLGTPPSKLVLGLPLYGRTFILTGSEEQGEKLGAPATNQGFKGPFTREDGFMGYNEICDEIKNNTAEWKMHWDEVSQTPFASKGNKVIAYDDPKSITEKIKLVTKYKLAGAMVWSIDTDDFHGDCAEEKSNVKGYPLMRAINAALAKPSEIPENPEDNEIPHGDMSNPDKDASSTIQSNLFFVISFTFIILVVPINYIF